MFVAVAGIDPGATTGLVVLLVPDANEPAHAGPMNGARWLDSRAISIPNSKHRSASENDAALFTVIREWLRHWSVQHVVLEEPWDAVPQRLQSRGTAFGLGKAYGLALAAAWDVKARCASYPVTSADERMSRGAKRQRLIAPRVGWMPTFRSKSGALFVQRREITLNALHELSCELRRRSPASGIIPRDVPMLGEDERMALGVLQFHLSRKPTL
jgi:hypothetical protein